MIRKRLKCANCGYEQIEMVFESEDEIQKWMIKNPSKVPGRKKCPKCGHPMNPIG